MSTVIKTFDDSGILFVRFYEERELEIQFGESYLQYKARPPFFGF